MTDAPPPLDLDSLPGHGIRRLQQIAVAVFLQEVEPLNLTPVQFAALQALAQTPGIDQRTLARSIGLDTSTTGGVIDRLESRGFVQRQGAPGDRRVRLPVLTDAGRELLREALPGVMRAQARMLEPLSPAERTEFMRMLQVLVRANNELSRAPSGPA